MTVHEQYDGNDRRVVSPSSIEKILDRLDSHFKEEAEYRREFGERFVSIESDLSSVSASMKKLADILERVSLIEEKDRVHNQALHAVDTSLREVKDQISKNKEETTARINAVDNKVNRWIYTATGITSTLIVIWTVLGGVVLNKVSTMDQVIDQVKIHMAIGQAQQQQSQQLVVPSIKGK